MLSIASVEMEIMLELSPEVLKKKFSFANHNAGRCNRPSLSQNSLLRNLTSYLLRKHLGSGFESFQWMFTWCLLAFLLPVRASSQVQ